MGLIAIQYGNLYGFELLVELFYKIENELTIAVVIDCPGGNDVSLAVEKVKIENICLLIEFLQVELPDSLSK